MALTTPEGTQPGTVMLQRPDSGALSTSSVNPGDLIQLGFDPSDVNIEADGKDLVFEFPDGGKITVSGFFEVEDVDQLPRLELADGAELTGADFLAAFNPDLLTAAGPSAGSAQSQGSSEYSDDSGAMIDGVGRLGSLGTDYWGRGTEVPDVSDSAGVERPMGSFTFNFGSDWGEGFQAVVYEDGQRNQHLHTKDELGSPTYGQITFDASLNGSTYITQIRMSGFEPGTRIWIGDPDGDGYEVFADANGVFTFTHGDFTGSGVYFLPPENSDADMTISYEVDIRTNTSGTDTVSGSFEIIVDAVADKPENVEADNGGTQYDGSVVVDGQGKEEFDDEGWSRNEMASSGDGADTGAASVSIPVTISAQFMDLDGSETHTLFIQAPGEGWECWVDGVKLDPVYDVPGHEGEAFYEIPAGSVTWDDNGNASADIVFTNDNEEMVSGDDWNMDLTVVAKAEENPTDKEYDLDNNTATSETQVTVNVDNINSSLSVNIGWASEGNNDNKHMGGDSSEYDYGGKEAGATGNEADGKTNTGAPITVSISGAEGSAEFIQSIVFDYDGDRGTLYLNGQPVEPGQLLEFDGDITSLDLVFVPATEGEQSYNSDDIDLSYTVTVGNESGASAVFNGSGTVVIDAVADKPEEVKVDSEDTHYDGTVVVDGQGKEEIGEDGWSRNEMQTGSEDADSSGVTVSIPMTISAKFFDFDGSETHTLYIQAPDGEGWELWIDGQLIEPNFNVPGHEGEAFYEIPADKVNWAEDGTASVDVTFKNSDPDMVSANDFQKDLTVIARAEETGINDREYDSGNNVASEETQVTVTVDNINSSLSVKVGWASEGNNDAKHLGADSSGYDYGGKEAGATGNLADGKTNTGAPITVSISGAEGSSESIQSVVFDYDSSRGTLYDADGNVIEPGVVYQYDGDTSIDFNFVPAEDGPQSYNSDDVDISYTVVVGNEAGATAEFNGSSTIVIDAVADKAEDLQTKDEYDGSEHVISGSDQSEEEFKEGWAEREISTDEHSVVEGGQVSINVTVSAQFFDFDGSETHTLYIQAPAGDGWTLIVDGQEISPVWLDIDGHEGWYYQIPSEAVSWDENGYASADVTFVNNNPDMLSGSDHSEDLKVLAVAEEEGGGREYDKGNDIAVEEGKYTLEIDNINSSLNVKAGWAYEGNDAGKYSEDGSHDFTGSEAGATGPDGAQLTISLGGEADGSDEWIDTITFNYDDSEGMLYDADGNAIPSGTEVEVGGPMGEYTYKPNDGSTSSADVKIDYEVVVKNDSGTTANLSGSSTIVIDAVADLADAELGDVIHPGLDGDGNLHLAADEATEQDGWYVSHTSKDTPVSLSLDLSATFHDLDGSEYAMILVALPDGVTVPLGEDGQPIYPFLYDDDGNQVYDASGNPYVVVREGQVGGQDGEFDQEENLSIDLIFSEDAKDSSISVTVRTQERDGDRQYDSGNDEANREVSTDISLPWLSSAMTVKVGWASEGNQNNKHLGDDSKHEYDGYGSDATITEGKNVGAPIQVEFADPDYVEQVTFTYDPSQGTLLFNGMPITGIEPNEDGTITIVINKNDFGLLDNMTFLPSDEYGDGDINLGYTVTVNDGSNTFIIEGDTTIVIDAVADWTKVENTEVSYADDASATAGGEAVTITVEAHFKDLDGSEDQYILIEVKDGWECPDASSVKTVYYDADGNILYPIGVDANGEFLYDESLIADSKDYWAVKVGEDGDIDYREDGQYDVTVIPPAQDSDGELTIGTGTLVEEKNTSGNEYDYSNNQAWDVGSDNDVTIRIDTIDGSLNVEVKTAFEDHQPNQHEGKFIEDKTSGVITISVSDDNGTEVINPDGSIRINFEFEGDEPGDFTLTLSDGSQVTYTAEQNDDGSWTLTIPGSDLPDGSKDINLRYNPPADDDTDLTGIQIEVDVKSGATGETGTLTADGGNLVVDAVADKPTEVKGSAEHENDAVQSGSGQVVELTISAEFGDYTDGSESHYLVISLANLQGIDLDNLPEGFTVVTGAEAGLNYGDGYVIIHVPNEYLQEHDGKVELTLDVVPKDVSDDTTLKVDFGAVAVEDTHSGEESRTDNNIAETWDSADITVHTITSQPTFDLGKAYENNTPNAHLGDESKSGGASVQIVVDGKNEVLTEVTITWNVEDGALAWGGQDLVPGEHVFTSDDGTVLTVNVTDNGDGTWSMNVSCDPEDAGVTGELNSNLTFKPSENFSDTDVNLTMEGTIKDTGSGEKADFGPTEGKVEVDAVAQKPTEVESQITYEDGMSAANESVDITVKASFRDYEDGSESHYLLIEAKSYFDTGDHTVITIGYKGGVPLTPVYDTNGKITGWLDPATGKSVTPDDTKSFIQIEVDSIIQEFIETGQAPEGWSVTVNGDGSVTVEHTETIDIDKSGLHKDVDGDTVITGGMAQETPSDQEPYKENNTAYEFDENGITIDVGIVTSEPEFGIEVGNMYENLTENAHEGDLSKGQAPSMSLKGIDTGETARVLLTFGLQNGGELNGTQLTANPDGTFSADDECMYIVVKFADGTEELVPLTPNGDGTWTADFEVPGGQDYTIEYHPGNNYNSDDLSVTYEVTVTDDASGDSKTWSNDPKYGENGSESGSDVEFQDNNMGIVVDAVAQQPDVKAEAGYGTDENGESFTAFGPNGDISLSVDITFHDLDGSESHYILIEAKTDWSLSDPIVITDANGVEHEFSLSELGYRMITGEDGGSYYVLELPEGFWDDLDSGEINVSIGVTPNDGFSSGSESWKVGGVTQEKHPDDGELRWDNNYAQNFDEVEVKMEGTQGLSISNSNDVYEGDNSQAHLGEGGLEGGTRLEIGWPNGDHTVENIEINYDHGSVYCFPKGTDADTIKQWLEDGVDSDGNPLSDYLIESGKKYDQDDLDGDLYFIADGTNDGDVTISITGDVTNNNTGETVTGSTDSTDVVVDAVAQKPEDLEGGESDGTYTITATFPDDDGSEDHFILVEAKPGGDLTMGDLSSKDGDFEIYWHQNDDGNLTPYYKVPTHDADGNLLPGVTDHGDGTYSVDVNYAGGGEFKTGGLTTDNVQDGDGELTFHNNTAVNTDGETLGDNSGGGEPHDPDWGEWLYPGGPHHHDPHCSVSVGSASENGTPNANIGINDYGDGDAKLVFGNSDGEMIVGYKTTATDPEGNASPEPNGVWCSPDYGPVESVTITFDSSEAALIIDGQYVLADDPDGRWTVEVDAEGNVTVTINVDVENGGSIGDLDIGLRPGSYGDAYADPDSYKNINDPEYDLSQFHNNDDSDISFEWSVSGTDKDGKTVTTGSNGPVDVTVDAVAQGSESVEDVSADDYGHVFGKDAGNQSATITLKATFIDTDGSEQHYFLVEMVPGLVIEGAETVYLDGVTYYRIPVEDGDIDPATGECTKEIEVTFDPNQASSTGEPTHNDDGSDSYTLNYGTMSEEKNMGHDAGNRETDLSNNMSYDVSGNLELKVSTVDSTVSVKVEHTYENDAETGQITVNVNLDGNDVLDEFSISYNGDAGEIVFDQSAFEAMGVVVTPEGPDANGNYTISFDGANAQEGWEELLKDGLTFSTEGNYTSKDANITWDAKVSDSLSGDSADFGGSQEVIVDAVAQGPDVSDVETRNENGFEAAESGGMVTVGLTLTFEDTGTGELHYAVMAYDPQWPCTKVLIYVDGQEDPIEVQPTLMYDQDGKPFWAVQVPDEYLDDTGSVRVEFEVQAPHSGDDTDHSLKAGGISVEPFDQDDKELTLDNNWSESLVEVPVNVAVATTEEVTFEVGTITENDASGAAITLSDESRQALADNGEIVTETTLSFEFADKGHGFSEGDVVGTVIYDGKAYEVTMGPDGKATVDIDFGPDGYDDSKEFRLIWGEVQTDAQGNVVYGADGNPVVTDFNHTGSDVTVGSDSKVQDTASGDTTDASGSSQADFDARADAPTDIKADGGDDVQGETITFSVTADFVDTDGSESHYILVECKDGWSGNYKTIEVDGKEYWQVPATPPSTDVTLTANDGTGDGSYEFNVGGMSVENSNGDTAYNLKGDSVSVEIGVVTADAVEMKMADCDEDTLTQISFDLIGGEKEVIDSITLTSLPKGAAIVDADGNVIWNGTSPKEFSLDMDSLDAGEYYYQPPANSSGDQSVGFKATVKDEASGETKDFKGTGEVNVAPITDTPVDVDGSAGKQVDQAGHTATVTVSFKADFVDMDGSEQHFFLVVLPVGVGAPAGWVELDPNNPADKLIIDQCGLTGSPIYRVEADGNGNAQATLSVPENYDGNIEFVAGSVEKENLEKGQPDYQFSEDTGEVHLSTGDINFGPNASDSSSELRDALRNPEEEVEGQLVMTDPDGDPISIVYGDGDTVEDGNILVLKGEYGTLRINTETGEYTYTLDPGVELPDGELSESFNITVADDRDGEDSATITVNINQPNTDPTGQDQKFSVGGGNETGEQVVVEGSLDLDDAEGDLVTIGSVKFGDKSALWDADNEVWVVEGDYGTLYVDADGGYRYVLHNEHESGRDEFTVAYSDPYGGTNENTITVDVAPINHAPEVDDSISYFDGSGSFIHGSMNYHDVDADHQGDSLTITSISYDGQEYFPDENGAFVIETEWGILQMQADGSWVYTASSREGAAGADTWESFEVTVSDEGGLSSTGNLDIGLGNPADPAPSTLAASIEPQGASADFSGLENLISGGAGSDILSATEGNDTFKWTLDDMPGLGDSYTDVIRDFGENGRDVLDLSDIGSLSADQLNAFFNGDGHFQISFNSEADGVQNIVIENISAASGQDAAAILQDMITTETIKLNSGG